MTHQIIMAINTTDELIQQRAVDSINRLKSYFGEDTTIEIVAYGPGLHFFTEQSIHQDTLLHLGQLPHVTLSACQNTINKIEKKTGQKPQLLSLVQVVAGGIVRVVELQEKGYAYLLP